MSEGVFRKGMVLAIIVCFVGAGVFSNITGNISIKNNNSSEMRDEIEK